MNAVNPAARREKSAAIILVVAAKYYWRFFGIFFVIASVLVGVLDVVNVAVGGGTDTFRSAFYSVDFSLAAPLVSGYYIHFLPLSAGSRTGQADALWRGTRALPAVFIAELVVTLGIAIGLLFFIVPGLVLAVRWCVVAPCISNKSNPWSRWYHGIGESVRLTTDSFWHVFCVIAFVAMIATVFSLGVDAISTTKTIRDIIAVAMQILNVSFGGTVLAVLYTDLVVRQTDDIDVEN